MTLYELFLFAHIGCAIVWLGSGVLMHALMAVAVRAADDAGVGKLFRFVGALDKRLFMPAALGTVIMGFALVGEGPWSFDQLWLVLALVGFAGTFAFGAVIMKPYTERIEAGTGPDGRMTPEALAVAKRVMVISQIDLAVLWLIVLDMVTKPTGGDGVLLASMALVLAAVVGSVVVRLRTGERIAAA